MRQRRTGLIVSVAVLALTLVAGLVSAQITIFDPAITSRNTTVAVLKQVLLDTLGNEADRLRQMAKRLSAFTDLRKYWISDSDTPEWRLHPAGGDQFFFANPYNRALNEGDPTGAAFEAVARTRVDAAQVLRALVDLAPEAEAAIVAQLATLDAADSSLIASTDQTGQLRDNGRKELAAIVALQDDALDPSTDQSATAVLDKISGAGLIRAQQQQARMQFLAGIVEQLLVDNKRARDSETATMNMQLERLRWGTPANQNLVAGAADDLRTWRQP